MRKCNSIHWICHSGGILWLDLSAGIGFYLSQFCRNTIWCL